MKYTQIIRAPSYINAEINLPASKSISNRALVIEELCHHSFQINNLSDANDTLLMQSLLNNPGKEKNVKNAGTVMRFLTAYYACSNQEVILKGEDRMYERPIGELVNALRSLGADIEYIKEEGYPPLSIKGKELKGGEISLPSNISSQFVSALLLIAPTIKEGLILHLIGNIASVPYIRLTLSILEYFGIKASWVGNSITIKHQKFVPRDISIESDWSSASYFWALCALVPGSEMYFPNLLRDSKQGDSIIKELMKPFGIEYQSYHSGIKIISNPAQPKNFEFNFIDYPDLIPTFTILCCAKKISFDIYGIETLKHKESDRALVLQNELKKWGYDIANNSKSLSCKVFPASFPKDKIILDTYNDHRMAMSFALLPRNSLIGNSDVVSKSFPGFWEELGKCGFGMLNS